jgi:Helix-turn-helix domain of resolvase
MRSRDTLYQGRSRHPKLARAGEETSRPPSHDPWVTIYEAVHALQMQGIPAATIARQLGISRPTVYAYLRREAPLGPTRPQFRWSTPVMTPYISYLIRRWRQSGATSVRLWREVRTLGYTHSAGTVCRFITELRRASEAGQAPETQGSPIPAPRGHRRAPSRSPPSAPLRSGRRRRSSVLSSSAG